MKYQYTKTNWGTTLVLIIITIFAIKFFLNLASITVTSTGLIPLFIICAFALFHGITNKLIDFSSENYYQKVATNLINFYIEEGSYPNDAEAMAKEDMDQFGAYEVEKFLKKNKKED